MNNEVSENPQDNVPGMYVSRKYRLLWFAYHHIPSKLTYRRRCTFTAGLTPPPATFTHPDNDIDDNDNNDYSASHYLNHDSRRIGSIPTVSGYPKLAGPTAKP